MTDVSSTSPPLQGTVEELKVELARSRQALREMSKVGMALLGERDPMSLFDLILTQDQKPAGF